MSDTDVAFFDIVHYLFSPAWCEGASALLGQEDGEDEGATWTAL